METTPMHPPRRPAGVSVVAWIWIVSGLFIIVGGVMGIGALSDLPELMPDNAHRTRMPAAVAVMLGLSHYLIWLTLIQLAVAVLAIVAGVYFLRLRAWARGVLELLTWLSLVMVISLGFFWLPMWMMTSEQFLPRDGSIDVEKVKMIGLVLGGVFMVVSAIPLAMMIKTLRSPAVKHALSAREREFMQ